MLIEINGVNGQYASINPDHIVRAVSSAGKGGWLAVVTLTGSPGTTLVCGGLLVEGCIVDASARLASGPMEARVKTVFTGTFGEVVEWAIAQVAQSWAS